MPPNPIRATDSEPGATSAAATSDGVGSAASSGVASPADAAAGAGVASASGFGVASSGAGTGAGVASGVAPPAGAGVASPSGVGSGVVSGVAEGVTASASAGGGASGQIIHTTHPISAHSPMISTTGTGPACFHRRVVTSESSATVSASSAVASAWPPEAPGRGVTSRVAGTSPASADSIQLPSTAAVGTTGTCVGPPPPSEALTRISTGSSPSTRVIHAVRAVRGDGAATSRSSAAISAAEP